MYRIAIAAVLTLCAPTLLFGAQTPPHEISSPQYVKIRVLACYAVQDLEEIIDSTREYGIHFAEMFLFVPLSNLGRCERVIARLPQGIHNRCLREGCPEIMPFTTEKGHMFGIVMPD